MRGVSVGIAGVLVVAALVGLLFAPAASATRYDIDVTKTIRGYTIHVVGWIDVDQPAKTVTGHLHVTVMDPTGKVVFDRVYDFVFTWSSRPGPIPLFLPGGGVVLTISFASMGGIAVTVAPVLVPSPLTPQTYRSDRVQ